MSFSAKGREEEGVLGKLSSVKKLLPTVPLPVNTSMDPSEKFSAAHTYGNFFLEYSLMSEYVSLQKQRLSGVYVVPSAGSPLKWFGVLFIRQGLYSGGVFKFVLYIPDNYPDCECPILVFEPPVFHPLINIETGEMDVKRGFPKWKRNVNHLWQVLLFARKMFYKIDTQSPLNPEAAVIYEKDLDLYRHKVSESLSSCAAKLYDRPSTDDPHAIQFSPWDPSIHEEVRRALTMESKREQGSVSGGYSWMQNGSKKIFSKP